jgi:hypothetical protein
VSRIESRSLALAMLEQRLALGRDPLVQGRHLSGECRDGDQAAVLGFGAI